MVPLVEIIFLGTNGWYDSKAGNTISILVKTNNFSIVLDAGNGISKLSDCVDNTKPVFLFISHYHLDHIEGLHTLVKNKGLKSLTIMVQDGSKPILQNFLKQPYTVPMEELPYPSELLELPKDSGRLPFKQIVLPMLHASDTIGIRMELEGKTITYCPDTGYCKNAVLLSEYADLLITECAFPPGITNDSWPHLNPELAARIAKESNAKKLYLTHFDAARYTNLASRKKAVKCARKIFPNSFLSVDGTRIKVIK